MLKSKKNIIMIYFEIKSILESNHCYNLKYYLKYLKLYLFL